ncbi:Hypothetical protein A7982_01729 [Minicystis rosea]|nr:Hypothetical protein A7982_01729 [Minicystis rosea]
MDLRACLLAFPLLAACSTGPTPEGTTPPSPTTSIATGQASGPASTPAATPAGRWTSASCGARTYERRLTLNPDGSFIAEDRVSPCPPGAVCVWAGIVFRRGKYTIANGAIQLAVEGPTAGPGQPLPSTLTIDPNGAPVEVLDQGTRCTYVRAQ